MRVWHLFVANQHKEGANWLNKVQTLLINPIAPRFNYLRSKRRHQQNVNDK